jgi:uncharacterized protein YbjT (DUF2867 family)
MKLLITGATGDVGSKVVRQLLSEGYRLRLFVRDAARARALFGDGVELCIGDLADPVSLQTACRGTEAAFLVSSGPGIPVLDSMMAAAARNESLRLVVKLSSLDAQENLAIGSWHAQGEAAIHAAGIPFTFVRPTGFMSNLLAWAPSIQAEGVVRSSTGNGRRPFIHSADIASVVVRCLTSDAYIGQCLAITGPEALSFPEITSRIGRQLGQTLRFESISDEEAARRFLATGASHEETAAHVELWRAIREDRLATVTDGVVQILGREPLPLQAWLAENLAAFYEPVFHPSQHSRQGPGCPVS